MFCLLCSDELNVSTSVWHRYRSNRSMKSPANGWTVVMLDSQWVTWCLQLKYLNFYSNIRLLRWSWVSNCVGCWMFAGQNQLLVSRRDDAAISSTCPSETRLSLRVGTARKPEPDPADRIRPERFHCRELKYCCCTSVGVLFLVSLHAVALRFPSIGLFKIMGQTRTLLFCSWLD